MANEIDSLNQTAVDQILEIQQDLLKELRELRTLSFSDTVVACGFSRFFELRRQILEVQRKIGTLKHEISNAPHSGLNLFSIVKFSEKIYEIIQDVTGA